MNRRTNRGPQGDPERESEQRDEGLAAGAKRETFLPEIEDILQSQPGQMAHTGCVHVGRAYL